jgi:hypothetical protein
MFKVILFFILSSFVQQSFAAKQNCAKLSKQVDSADDNYRPPLEGKVICNKKLYFYTAPDAQCKMEKVFVIKGDSLTVYKPYKDWLNVMYIAKDGEDYTGWVSARQI